MKNNKIYFLLVLTIILFIIGILFLNKNKSINKSNIEIIDATFSKCNPPSEFFYEDNKYRYSFPCVKSSSIFVKFSNGNKMLVTDALKNNKVTIDELIKAGLDVITEKK